MAGRSVRVAQGRQNFQGVRHPTFLLCPTPTAREHRPTPTPKGGGGGCPTPTFGWPELTYSY